MEIENIGSKLRRLREINQLSLSHVASSINVDIAILSKMERGQRPLTREIISQLAEIYKYNPEKLTILFLSQKIISEIGEEHLALKAMNLAQKQLKNQQRNINDSNRKEDNKN